MTFNSPRDISIGMRFVNKDNFIEIERTVTSHKVYYECGCTNIHFIIFNGYRRDAVSFPQLLSILERYELDEQWK